jgi:hypothetical protein
MGLEDLRAIASRRRRARSKHGIAGEDDLDAPDLGVPRQAAGVPVKSGEVNGSTVLTGGVQSISGSRKSAAARPVHRTLTAQASSTLRADLEGELARLRSSEEALAWAQRVLATKNTLPDEDAHAVEEAFEQRWPCSPAKSRSRRTRRLQSLILPHRRRRRRDGAGTNATANMSRLSHASCGGEARRMPSPPVHRAAGAWAEGKRRVHRSALPDSSSRGAR